MDLTYTAWLSGAAIFATICAIFVLVEYLVLVNVWKHRGAQRLALLLAAMVAMLLATVARYVLGEYPGRTQLMTTFFFVLGLALLYLGWHIAADQIQGARKWRERKRQSKEDHHQ